MLNVVFLFLLIVMSIVLMKLLSNTFNILKVLVINHIALILTMFTNLTLLIFKIVQPIVIKLLC